MSNPPDLLLVTVSMTLEEASRRWLRDNNLCAIEWSVLEEIRKDYAGDKIAFDPKNCTFVFRDHAKVE